MAVAAGKFVGVNGNSNALFGRKDVEDRKLSPKRNVKAMASVSCGKLGQEYKLLRLKPDAGEKEVKKAYRRLALQYHPDVCKGENCGTTFHKINEAYQIVMSTLMEATKEEEYYADEGYMGFDEWEEWMGFEGGCATRDYSNHINFYT